MNTAVIITLIIVAGVVLISLVGIGWLWSMTSRGLMPGSSAARQQKELEKKVNDLQKEVDDLKKRLPSE
ncbi:MAG: bZIP transcription factor [Armatimonadota bacterium]